MRPDVIPQSKTHRTVGGTAYFLSHTAAWTLYGVVQYLISRGPFGPRIASVVAWCGTGMIGTDLLLRYVNYRRWSTLQQLIRPFAIGAVLIAALMNVAAIVAGVFLFGESPGQAPHWLIAAHSMQALLVVSVWCAVVLAANEVNRRRVAEMEALQLALIAQVSQFRALRSQLNPHFLFNCLNSLRELIDEEPGRAKQVIDLLSALLRYTLRADRVETVSLKEELSAVEDYLSLEKVRFEERLRTHFDIDPQSLDSTLPPMLLQTLAENGVKHGIARLPAGGELHVTTQKLADELRVEVVNTGVLSATAEGSLALGLKNARERLRLMYGDRASLTLTARNDCTVSAELLIPLQAAGVGS